MPVFGPASLFDLKYWEWRPLSKSRDKNKGGGIDQLARKTIAIPWLFWTRTLLIIAVIAGAIVYSPAVRQNFMYDDSDYILADPRLDHPELFLPSGWKTPPPPLADEAGEELHLPAYQRPLIEDRFLWRLSFGMERWLLGAPQNATRSYVINIIIHLACVLALFFAVRALLALYREDKLGSIDAPADSTETSSEWSLLPGLAALVFAVHPWTSESVCYISARNGSMGTFFVLLGTLSSVEAVRLNRVLWMRALGVFLALLCALLAYGCKENMITAIAGYLLVTLPVLARRAWRWSPVASLGGIASVGVLLFFTAWLGIQSSNRAAGLLAQTGGGRGWDYFLTIQNPILLMTFGDMWTVARMSLETNHPLWPLWACWLALIANAALLLLGTVGGMLRAPLLGIGWFYIHLIPTNSFLPRPEFLAGRNVYLSVAGFAVLAAALGIFLWIKLATAKPSLRKGALAVCAAACLYWATSAFLIAREYTDGVAIWARSARMAPDHATVRLNHAAALLTFRSLNDPDVLKQAEAELLGALKAEDSETMQYHTERPRLVRRSNALRALGHVCLYNKRNTEAADYLRQSWNMMPALHVWTAWIDAVQETKRDSQIEEAIAAGLQRWPNAWWPYAVRGLRAASNITRPPYPSQIMADLRRASNEPDSKRQDLRVIQMKVEGLLAQVDREKAWEHVDRLKRLGAPPADVDRIIQRLQSQGIQR